MYVFFAKLHRVVQKMTVQIIDSFVVNSIFSLNHPTSSNSSKSSKKRSIALRHVITK